MNVSFAFWILSKDISYFFYDLDNKEIVGIVNTNRGNRLLVTAAPPKSFWQKWRTDKYYVKDNSVSVSKNFGGEWQICLWIPWND